MFPASVPRPLSQTWTLFFCLLLSACAPGFSRVPNAAEGVASWYGPGFDGNSTANGEVFDTTAVALLAALVVAVRSLRQPQAR